MELKILKTDKELGQCFVREGNKLMPDLNKLLETQANLTAEQIVEWVEKHSHPMNANMYGISLSREDWQVIKELAIINLPSFMEAKDTNYLILVYPEGGGQPKEVWWLKTEEELKQKQELLAKAHPDKLLVSFRRNLSVLKLRRR